MSLTDNKHRAKDNKYGNLGPFLQSLFKPECPNSEIKLIFLLTHYYCAYKTITADVLVQNILLEHRDIRLSSQAPLNSSSGDCINIII